MQECSWIGCVELNKLKAYNLQASVRLCEEVLRCCHQVLPSDKLHPNSVIVALSKLDTEMGRFILDKQLGSQKAKDPRALGLVFLKELQDLGTAGQQLQTRWTDELDNEGAPPVDQSLSAQTADDSNPLLRLAEYDESGQLVDGLALVRRGGFDVGSCVGKHAQDIFRVDSVVGDTVSLKSLGVVSGDEPEPTKVNIKVFLKEYTLQDESGLEVEHPGWPSKRPEECKAYRDNAYRAMITTALACVKMACTERESLPKLRILMKPSRSVKTTDAYAKGQLVLVPDTSRIVSMEEGAQQGLAARISKSDGSATIVEMTLMPMFSDVFVCPAWAVKTTTDPKKINMAWALCKVTQVGIVDLPKEVLGFENR